MNSLSGEGVLKRCGGWWFPRNMDPKTLEGCQKYFFSWENCVPLKEIWGWNDKTTVPLLGHLQKLSYEWSICRLKPLATDGNCQFSAPPEEYSRSHPKNPSVCNMTMNFRAACSNLGPTTTANVTLAVEELKNWGDPREKTSCVIVIAKICGSIHL